MPKEAEFEEKEYEGPLNHELAGASPFLWPPGQVFENHFGIDAAMQVEAQQFWSRVGFVFPLSGAILADYSFGSVWDSLGHKRPLSDFSCNLFLQTKRPQVAVRRSAALVTHGLSSPYWRFGTTPHQQRALERLEQRLGHRALVSYACAAFDSLNDLYTFIRNRQLVEQSTFAKVGKLNNHQHWVYDKPGTTGFACSDPELNDDEPILTQIRNLAQSGDNGVSDTFPESNLARIAEAIRAVCQEESEEFDNPRAAIFLNLSPDRTKEESKENTLPIRPLTALLDVELFSRLFQLNWRVIGPS